MVKLCTNSHFEAVGKYKLHEKNIIQIDPNLQGEDREHYGIYVCEVLNCGETTPKFIERKTPDFDRLPPTVIIRLENNGIDTGKLVPLCEIHKADGKEETKEIDMADFENL